MDVADLLDALRPVNAHTLITTDFDGVLAPLMTDPQESRPADGALGALAALREAGAPVAVITGRDAQTVIRLGGLDTVPGLTVSGLYGIETWAAGRLTTPDEPESITRLRAQLPAALDGADPDLWIEDKRLSLVVHARRTADPYAALGMVGDRVRSLAAELGLEVHPGAQVLELRVPGFDKGSALDRLVEQHRPDAVLYLGDDLGDLPAFERIAALRAEGVAAWSVGVMSSGAQPVAQLADVLVEDPAAAVALLTALTAPAG